MPEPGIPDTKYIFFSEDDVEVLSDVVDYGDSWSLVAVDKEDRLLVLGRRYASYYCNSY